MNFTNLIAMRVIFVLSFITQAKLCPLHLQSGIWYQDHVRHYGQSDWCSLLL